MFPQNLEDKLWPRPFSEQATTTGLPARDHLPALVVQRCRWPLGAGAVSKRWRGTIPEMVGKPWLIVISNG